MTEGIPKIREIIRKNPITTALLSMLIGGIVTNTYDEGSKQWLVGSRILHLQEKNLLEMTEYSQKIDSIFDKISIIDKDESIKSEDKNKKYEELIVELVKALAEIENLDQVIIKDDTTSQNHKSILKKIEKRDNELSPTARLQIYNILKMINSEILGDADPQKKPPDKDIHV